MTRTNSESESIFSDASSSSLSDIEIQSRGLQSNRRSVKSLFQQFEGLKTDIQGERSWKTCFISDSELDKKSKALKKTDRNEDKMIRDLKVDIRRANNGIIQLNFWIADISLYSALKVPQELNTKLNQSWKNRQTELSTLGTYLGCSITKDKQLITRIDDAIEMNSHYLKKY